MLIHPMWQIVKETYFSKNMCHANENTTNYDIFILQIVPAEADEEDLLKLFALYKNLLIFMMSLNLKWAKGCEETHFKMM